MIETQLRTHSDEYIRNVGFYWGVNPNLLSVSTQRIHGLFRNSFHFVSNLLGVFFLQSKSRRIEPN